MDQRQPRSETKTRAGKISILLVDAIAERRALRKKIMAMRGVEVIGAVDLTEASSIWHRDRYDMVLVDIRADHRGCVAFRDEIKKESPAQIVAFLVGKPKYIDLNPAPDSYVSQEHGVQWGEAMRKAVSESCDSLSQRNGFVEASWRISAGRRMNGPSQTASEGEAPAVIEAEAAVALPRDLVSDDDKGLSDVDGLSQILERLA